MVECGSEYRCMASSSNASAVYEADDEPTSRDALSESHPEPRQHDIRNRALA